MLKLEILIALFATLLQVQAEYPVEDRDREVDPRLHAASYHQGVAVPAKAAVVDAAKKNDHVVTVTANTVAVVTATAVANAFANKDVKAAPLARHHGHEEKKGKHCGVPHHAHKHHGHKHAEACGVEHEHPVAHAKAHKAHGHKHAKACGVEHEHPVAHAKAHKAHAKAHKAHKDVAVKNPMKHIKEHCPLAAHVDMKGHKLPGKGHAEHDSNDFASFEVAQLDILRVTKLDSEHKHDDHENVVDKDVKDAIARRSEDMRKGVKEARKARVVHKAARKSDKDVTSHKDRKARRHHRRHSDVESDREDRHKKVHRRRSERKLNRKNRKEDRHEVHTDSDDDVRAHVRPIVRARAHARASVKSDDEKDRRPHVRARAAVQYDDEARMPRVVGSVKDKTTDVAGSVKDKTTDVAGSVKDTTSDVTGNVKGAVKGTAKGFGNAISNTFSFGKKSIKGAVSDKKDNNKAAPAAAATDKGKDLHLSPSDRSKLTADLKAISELDREALQYLDTSCGPIKALDSKKTRRAETLTASKKDKASY